MPEYGLGSRTRALRVLASDPEGRVVSPRDHPTMLKALAVGMRELREGGRTREAVAGVNDRTNPLSYGRV